MSDFPPGPGQVLRMRSVASDPPHLPAWNAGGPMFYVPLYIEGLRARPVLVFWLATLAQAAVWFLAPLLFYAAPPGELAHLLAVGREFPLTGAGPPLAYWLAETAFRAAGLPGVYLLSQLCVIATYASVFALGGAIVGGSHAAMAVLLMVGISVFTVPTPEFGPALLASALWAATLLFYWRAVGDGRRRFWYPLGGAAVLLLLTSDAAGVLIGTLVVFTLANKRGRASLVGIEALIATAAVVVALVMHLWWFERLGSGLEPILARLRDPLAAGANTTAWLRLLAALIVAHAGLAVLVVLASGWPRTRASPPPPFIRATVAPFAVTFVKAFAVWPAVLVTAMAVVAGYRLPIGNAAPLFVLSGLAVVLAAGKSIELRHTRILGFAWAGLLIVPAIFIPVVIGVLPWTIGTELKVAQPATAMGRFFANSFIRRTGHPLAIVGGDERLAELVAVGAPSRPSVYFAADPTLSSLVAADDVRNKGAVIVWPAADTNPAPPPAIKARFPDLVPEVPQSFERPVRGRLPPLLVGWGVIRPAAAPPPAVASPSR